MNGFTIQAVAPAALPSCFFSACDSVVNRMIGTNLYCGIARTWRVNSRPSILGMLTSVRIRSTSRPASLPKASTPSVASITS